MESQNREVRDWRPIPTLRGILVSSDGQVARASDGHLFAQHSSYGYRIVSLGDRNFRVHRLVLEAFVCPCPAGQESDHIDRNRGNNDVANLRWVTRRENLANRATGPWAGRRLTDEQVREIRRSAPQGAADEIRQLAERYSVTAITIHNVLNKKTWKHL